MTDKTAKKAADAAEADGPAPEPSPYIWVMSNRHDDRVVLFEHDAAHPGGEAFVGGDGPDQVARTTRVVTLLRDGLLIEVPEPVDGRKKPVAVPARSESVAANQPGQPIALGREPDPERYGTDVDAIKAAQAAGPDSVAVPVGVVVPPVESNRETSRR